MPNKKRVLGRGLNALLGQSAGPEAAPGPEKYKDCPIADISPNALQPRRTFSEAALRELASSIKEKGIIEPVVVRRSRASGGFELIAGERRWRAAKIAGLSEVPAVIVEATDEESLEFAIIENIQRENLNAIEEAEAYRSLVGFGLTQEEVARKVGKDRATVANYLRLLNLPVEVREELVKGAITMGHARAVLSLEGRAAQIELCRVIVHKNLNVREAEKLASAGGVKTRKKKGAAANPLQAPLEEELRRIFGTKIKIIEKRGKGRVEILYYSTAERERVIELLRSISAL